MMQGESVPSESEKVRLGYVLPIALVAALNHYPTHRLHSALFQR
jgi:hypothetical protein